jgi:hypothetical protein
MNVDTSSRVGDGDSAPPVNNLEPGWSDSPSAAAFVARTG